MKEIDDTNLTNNECQCCSCQHDWEALFTAWNRESDLLRALMLRVANLETQRTPADTNPDPEWF